MGTIKDKSTQRGHFGPLGAFSVRDVAGFLRVSPRTVRRWIRGGRIRAVKTASGRYRVVPSEVERLVPGVFGGTGEEKKEGDGEGEEKEKPMGLEDYREAALHHLKRGIDLSGRQLQSQELSDQVKIRWAHCLAQLVAAYVNFSKAMGTGDEEKTLATLFIMLDKVPKKYRRITMVGVAEGFGKKLGKAGA